jgi:hypothetical protein
MIKQLIKLSVLENKNLLFVTSNYMAIKYCKAMLINGKDLVMLIKGHALR